MRHLKSAVMPATDVQTPIVRPTTDHSFLSSPRFAYPLVIAVILAIYSYPSLRTAFVTGSFRLPSVAAPDAGLYLSIATLEKDANRAVVNPYYRIGVPYPIAYLKFRLGPFLFGFLNQTLFGRIWLSMFLWNLLWWLFVCVAALWLFSQFVPKPQIELVLAGVTFFTLLSIEGVFRAVTAFAHNPHAWPPGWLPYIRPFSPQVAMPLFLLYLGLLFRVLERCSFGTWAGMALLQFLAFTAFPYATLMMAGTTLVAVLWLLCARPRTAVWREVFFFAAVCAVLDLAFAMHGSAGYRLSFPDQSSLIRFQPELLPKVVGKLWILTAILVMTTALSRRIPPRLKWPLVGLGLSNLLFITGDALVSERVFFLSDHIGYFYQPTVVVLSLFLVTTYLPSGVRSRQVERVACVAIILGCFACGSLMAEANYRTNLAYNQEQADLARWFAKGQVSARDLVVVQFTGSAYDSCEWIPMLSKAEVLYCRNAQLTLTPEQNRDVQRLREILYLYFIGKDRQWLQTSTQFETYGLYGELSSYRRPEEYAQRVIALRQEMLPLFTKIEEGDPSIRSFFRRFRRVWIIQQKNPAFVRERLESYLDVGPQESAGTISVTAAVPK